eukprot:359367-Chlamydomonas_euryale.AAC.2
MMRLPPLRPSLPNSNTQTGNPNPNQEPFKFFSLRAFHWLLLGFLKLDGRPDLRSRLFRPGNMSPWQTGHVHFCRSLV